MNYGRKPNVDQNNISSSNNNTMSSNQNNKGNNAQITQETAEKVISAKMNAQLDYLKNKCSTNTNYLTQDPLYDYPECESLKNTARKNAGASSFGPPLAACDTYDVKKIATCGTLFYPLHA